MTREEKARWLSDFYARVAEGEEMLCDGISYNFGPDWASNPLKWTTRKPKRGMWVLYSQKGGVVDFFTGAKPEPERWPGKELVWMEEPDAHT